MSRVKLLKLGKISIILDDNGTRGKPEFLSMRIIGSKKVEIYGKTSKS